MPPPGAGRPEWRGGIPPPRRGRCATHSRLALTCASGVCGSPAASAPGTVSLACRRRCFAPGMAALPNPALAADARPFGDPQSFPPGASRRRLDSVCGAKASFRLGFQEPPASGRASRQALRPVVAAQTTRRSRAERGLTESALRSRSSLGCPSVWLHAGSCLADCRTPAASATRHREPTIRTWASRHPPARLCRRARRTLVSGQHGDRSCRGRR